MPLPSDDTSQPDAAPGPDPARGPDDGVQFDDVAPLDEPITLPPESDLDIRPTGAKRSDRPKIEMPVGEDAPWEQSELAPGQRRRRLMILGAVVLVFVLGAVLWAVGVGHSIGGNFEAASNRADEVNLRSAAAEVPADDYELSIDRCDTDATTGRGGGGHPHPEAGRSWGHFSGGGWLPRWGGGRDHRRGERRCGPLQAGRQRADRCAW